MQLFSKCSTGFSFQQSGCDLFFVDRIQLNPCTSNSEYGKRMRLITYENGCEHTTSFVHMLAPLLELEPQFVVTSAVSDQESRSCSASTSDSNLSFKYAVVGPAGIREPKDRPARREYTPPQGQEFIPPTSARAGRRAGTTRHSQPSYGQPESL